MYIVGSQIYAKIVLNVLCFFNIWYMECVQRIV